MAVLKGRIARDKALEANIDETRCACHRAGVPFLPKLTLALTYAAFFSAPEWIGWATCSAVALDRRQTTMLADLSGSVIGDPSSIYSLYSCFVIQKGVWGMTRRRYATVLCASSGCWSSSPQEHVAVGFCCCYWSILSPCSLLTSLVAAVRARFRLVTSAVSFPFLSPLSCGPFPCLVLRLAWRVG